MVTGRQVTGQLDANSRRKLRVQHRIRRRVVEAESDVLELVHIDTVHDVRCGRGAVREVLHLRGERGTEIELEPGELDARFLRGLENVDAALVEWPGILDARRSSLFPGRFCGRLFLRPGSCRW